jgi:hypothetical protein
MSGKEELCASEPVVSVTQAFESRKCEGISGFLFVLFTGNTCDSTLRTTSHTPWDSSLFHGQATPSKVA